MRQGLRLLLAAALAAGGCEQTNETVAPREADIALTVTNLPPLEHGEGSYRLWARIYEFSRRPAASSVTHSELVSLGDFAVDPATGACVDSAGRPVRFRIPDGWNPQLLASVMVTVQPHAHATGPRHEEPGPVLIAGALTGDEVHATATLTTASPEAFGTDFTAARGKYTVIAPTSPADSLSGVWFVDMTVSPPAGIQGLPAPPPGWVYEGWVTDLAAQPPVEYSTGRFRRPDSADYDGPGPGRGPLPGLDFPGQDFITGTPMRPNLDSPRYTFQVTVEPASDDAPGASPFLLFTSVPVTPAGAGPISRDLYSRAGGLPTAAFRMTRP